MKIFPFWTQRVNELNRTPNSTQLKECSLCKMIWRQIKIIIIIVLVTLSLFHSLYSLCKWWNWNWKLNEKMDLLVDALSKRMWFSQLLNSPSFSFCFIARGLFDVSLDELSLSDDIDEQSFNFDLKLSFSPHRICRFDSKSFCDMFAIFLQLLRWNFTLNSLRLLSSS